MSDEEFEAVLQEASLPDLEGAPFGSHDRELEAEAAASAESVESIVNAMLKEAADEVPLFCASTGRGIVYSRPSTPGVATPAFMALLQAYFLPFYGDSVNGAFAPMPPDLHVETARSWIRLCGHAEAHVPRSTDDDILFPEEEALARLERLKELGAQITNASRSPEEAYFLVLQGENGRLRCWITGGEPYHGPFYLFHALCCLGLQLIEVAADPSSLFPRLRTTLEAIHAQLGVVDLACAHAMLVAVTEPK